MAQKNYKFRIVDDKIDTYLKIAKSLLIVGPKWCGKTWTGIHHSNSYYSLMDKNTFYLAKNNPDYILKEEYPQLIDEWQVVPEIWDAVRNKCDSDSIKGKYILTGSTTINDKDKDVIKHSGTGRIIPIQMYPMTLFEQGYSSDDVSLLDLKNNAVKVKAVNSLTIQDFANLIIKGGFPDNIDTPNQFGDVMPRSYIDSICNEDIFERKTYKKNPKKLRNLLASLARNEATITSDAKIINDMEDSDTASNVINSAKTLNSYLDYLNSIYLLWYQNAFSCNYRSKSRIGVKAKRHFVDPSLASAALNLTSEKLMNDFNTFGFLFESFVERDLKVYMDYYGGDLYHFRDNLSGDEVDAICEFSDGEYGAIEIKLSSFRIDEAKESLIKFYKNVSKKPKFKCIIVGEHNMIQYDKENDIYVIPFSCLGLHKK